jgi:hypothetical protein
MLSKCFNSHCSATFQYLGQGRLFRIDFSEAKRKSPGVAVSAKLTSKRSKTYPIEHFWLCEKCAGVMALEIGNAGEVRLVSLDKPVAGPTRLAEKTRAAAS